MTPFLRKVRRVTGETGAETFGRLSFVFMERSIMDRKAAGGKEREKWKMTKYQIPNTKE